ncbi:MazG nucleotide pyrophosphohydrolase domain-containing protein [Nocardia sp. JCM 34519]|uniref:MazG nucleotide pyrophosphohydrolase domain-containing protein n=1 Tax=Nocardia sp. JCM 34519 TaxID=2876118 RepID=UPI001CE413C2|nr:MazG nucleotide pyrophosphohydrolase domain-containing protein [Nocardia sp. JCM 34519]
MPDADADAGDIAEVQNLSAITVLGVRVSTEVVVATSVHDAGVALHRTGDGFTLFVPGSSWRQARGHGTEILLALIARCTAMLYLKCHIVQSAAGTGLLVIDHADTTLRSGPGADVLVDANSVRPTAHIVDPARLWKGEEPEPVTVAAIALRGDEVATHVPPKLALPQLRTRLGVPTARLARLCAGPGALQILADLDAAIDTQLLGLATAIPAICTDTAGLADWARHGDLDALVEALPMAYSPIALDGLRALQATAGQVYGRLEPDPAMVWTLEELGEVAQAVRRRENPARIGQELGQLLNWALCLANICELDLADHAARTLAHEVGRQLSVHGALHPYQSQPFRAVRS